MELHPAFVPMATLPSTGSVLDDLDASRAAFDAAWGPLAPGGEREVKLPNVRTDLRTITGPDGNDLLVRIYSPTDVDGLAPGLLLTHGGGFVLGNVDAEHTKAVRWCGQAGCVVASVDWRRAPEHPFPAGIEDSYTALCWLVDHAGELAVDTERIGVAGSSSGGCFAAALALMARDRRRPALQFQCLIYPVLSDSCDSPSMLRDPAPPGWTQASAKATWAAYLGTGTTEVSPYASPSRATDLRGLPPAYILTADYDVLRDEGIDYARRLMEADVPVHLHNFPGAIHGFEMMAPHADISREAMQEQVEAVRRGLAAKVS